MSFWRKGLHDIDHEEDIADEQIENRKYFSLADIVKLTQGDKPFDGPTLTAISMACTKLGLKLG